MIEFQDVSKHYGEQDVLVRASFRILGGDRVGVVGPNGAGKSTVFGMITGTIESDGGSVHLQSGIRLGYLRQVLNNRECALPLSDYVADAVPEVRLIEERIHAIEHDLLDANHPRQSDLLEELGICKRDLRPSGAIPCAPTPRWRWVASASPLPIWSNPSINSAEDGKCGANSPGS
jgi:ATP-binding cassette, subfamily F, member 3